MLTRVENNITIHVSPWQLDSFFHGNIADFVLGAPALGTDLSRKLYIDSADATRFLTVGTYRQLVGKLTHVLRTQFGVREGDTVCLLLTNSIYLPALHIAILAAGATVSPANIAYLPHELGHQLRISGASLLIGMDQFLDTVEQAQSGLEFKTTTLANVLSSIDKDTPTAEPVHMPDGTQPAYYCFSSGTSGVPKGVVTSHANIVANVTQQGIAAHKSLYTDGTVYAAVLPMSHIYGLSTFIYAVPTVSRGTVVVFEKFDFEKLLRSIVENAISFVHVVPPMAVLFAKSTLVEKYDLSPLKRLMSGAAPLSQSLIDEITERLSVTITQSYGLTETSPINTFGCFSTQYDAESCGWLMPGLEARLVDVHGKNVHGVGRQHSGEVWLRGPNVTVGYLNNPKATVASFDETGKWFKTGDVGVVSEDGQWYIVDRFKELIKSKGHQVAPAELDSILLEHPDVVDAAVAGIPVPEQGTELPRAYVVLREGVDPLAIKKWFDGRVARYKRLWGGVVVVAQVPKSPSGKIQRRLLRDRVGDVVFGYEKSKL